MSISRRDFIKICIGAGGVFLVRCAALPEETLPATSVPPLQATSVLTPEATKMIEVIPKTKAKKAGTGSSTGYQDKILSLFGANMLAYWPFSETTGTVAADVSGNGRNVTYTDVTLNNTTSLQGKPAVHLGPTAGYMTIGTALSSLDATEGTVSGWMKYAAGQWSAGDADDHVMFNFVSATAGNVINLFLRRAGGYGNCLYATYTAGGANPTTATLGTVEGGCLRSEDMSNSAEAAAYGIAPPSPWFHWALTWSKSNDRLRIYIDGIPMGEATGLGTWTGVAPGAVGWIGAYYISRYGGAKGDMSDMFVLNREATPAEMRIAATVNVKPLKIAHLGDSISVYADSFAFQYPPSYNSGFWIYRNVAQGGNYIRYHFTFQASRVKNADRVIIELGTNDQDNGDMPSLQALLEEGMDTLKAQNPDAIIYYMNVLPNWNWGSKVEIQKPNIRATIAAACANKSITCWDTYTNPWITIDDTLDGLHPNAGGHAKIAAQVLARMA